LIGGSGDDTDSLKRDSGAMASNTDVVIGDVGEDAFNPTLPAPMTNVAEYGFEGRFGDWADDARYFEYSKAANPIGSGHTSHIPITSFGRDLYLDGPTRVKSMGVVYGLT
jgi:hypothetical protein